MYYYSIPSVFKAMQYDGTNLEEIRNFNNEVPNKQIPNEDLFIMKDGKLMIHTLGTNFPFNIGDYVILGKDQLQPVSKGIFESLYHELNTHEKSLVFDISHILENDTSNKASSTT